jgi:uncharacterized protein (DUF3084 family)
LKALGRTQGEGGAVNVEQRIAKLEAEVEHLKKTQEQQGSDIKDLDKKTDEMGKFAVKIDIVVENLDKTTKNIEKTLTEYITEQRAEQKAKEDEERKSETQQKDQEISKWKTVTFELAKWTLILMGGGKLLQEGAGVFESLFK